VAAHGLDHFRLSMDAQHALTRASPARAASAHTSNAIAKHVRRLVSEGTRPPLPWAPRVSWLVPEPEPGLALLDRLKDGPSETVRRSVANHLPDVAKAHPGPCSRSPNVGWPVRRPERQQLVRHTLRTLIERGDRTALAITGFGGEVPALRVRGAIHPKRAPIGGAVAIDVELTSEARASVVIDLVVHYVKANGETRPKVFKWRELTLEANQPVRLSRTLSLVQRTTRAHRSGEHRVQIQVQGSAFDVASFVVTR
jgi:3-methyladenine DNA glycosylase AlkC